MKRFGFAILLCAVILIVVGCSQTELRLKPAHLIPEDKFVEMLTEQMVMESTIFYASADIDKEKLTRSSYTVWMKKYGITREAYETSVNYYFTNEDDSERIMNQVRENLEKKRAQLH